MFQLFKRKELTNSAEYEKVLKRIAELNTQLDILKARIDAQDVKVDAYRNEIKNVKKKAKELIDDIELDKRDTEKDIYNDGFDSLRTIGI